MKATRKIGLWKAIAFLTVILTFSACDCREEPSLKPEIIDVNFNLIEVESFVSLELGIVPNGNTEVIFRYREVNQENFTIEIYPEKIDGMVKSNLVFRVENIIVNSVYYYEIIASNKAGVVQLSGKLVTGNLIAFISPLKPENLTKNSVKLVATVIPYINNTQVIFEYSEDKVNWKKKYSSGFIGGFDSIKVSVDISSLKENTVYYYRIKILNSERNTESKVNYFQTYSVIDGDGNYYHTVTINGQTWLKENFRGTHYLNGDPILTVSDLADINSEVGAYCWYDNDLKNGQIYGGLYNWYVANDSRELVSGFRTPEEKDWEVLFNYIASTYGSGHFNNVARSLMSTNYWIDNLLGDDKVGFSAVPAGVSDDGQLFFFLGEASGFWTKEQKDNLGSSAKISTLLKTYIADYGYMFKKRSFSSIRLVTK